MVLLLTVQLKCYKICLLSLRNGVSTFSLTNVKEMDAIVSTFSAFEMKEAGPLILAWAVFLNLLLTLPGKDDNNELMVCSQVTF